MNRIDRLNALMIQLQSKPRVTVSEMEDKFELSRRTIFRDIKALIEAGVPIGGDAGSGYFIVDGYHLPPVVFSKEEASAILLGAKFVEQNADSETINTFEDALTKVRAVLRFTDKEYLDNLDKRIAVLPAPVNQLQGFPDSHLNQVQYAIASKRALSLEYYSSYKDETTRREVEPLGMVFYSGRWHLIGYCRLREDLRDFRTDRITKLDLSNDQFDPDSHPHYLDFLQTMVTGTDAVEMRIWVSKEVFRFFGEQKFYFGFIDQEESDNGIQMRFITPFIEGFARWLLSFGHHVRILSPDLLENKMSELAKEIFEHYKK